MFRGIFYTIRLPEISPGDTPKLGGGTPIYNLFNKLTSVFYASVLLLMINFVRTLSKFVADPLACGWWIYNTLTMLSDDESYRQQEDRRIKN